VFLWKLAMSSLKQTDGVTRTLLSELGRLLGVDS